MDWGVGDTHIVSFGLKRDTRARLYRRHLLGRAPVIAFMTLAELHAWAQEHRWGVARRDELARHLGQYEVYHADDALCRLWTDVWTRARRQGDAHRRGRCLGAATALALDVPLATRNVADFAGVEG